MLTSPSVEPVTPKLSRWPLVPAKRSTATLAAVPMLTPDAVPSRDRAAEEPTSPEPNGLVIATKSPELVAVPPAVPTVIFAETAA